jgi:CheY-like chemotaxis protein
MAEAKEATRPKPSRARMLPLEPRPARPNRALLVDDGSAGYEIYVQRLRAEGYEVTRASDPGSAVELAQHWEPNLIFVPGGPGDSRRSAFLGALKANDHTRHIPVVLLSSYFNVRSEKDGLTAFTRP